MKRSRLYAPSYIKDILNEYGFKFSKSLGQNFLIDGNIVRNIVQAAGITKEDYVLEVGPGIGTLTEELALNARKVVAVELDRGLLPVLADTLSEYNNIEIVPGDILKININELIGEKLGGGPIKLVANLPYYVTTPIIGRFLEEDLNIQSITVMVQKELADRMVAGPGSKTYGSLSIFVNFYTNPKILLRVPKTVFMPQPKINSAVVKLAMKENLYDIDRDKFFKLVKAGFSKRRKTILNALSSFGFDIDREVFRTSLEKAGISPSERAENLSIEDFMNICAILPPLNI